MAIESKAVALLIDLFWNYGLYKVFLLFLFYTVKKKKRIAVCIIVYM